jgi:hypothetical protein
MITWIRVRVKHDKNKVRKGERLCREEDEGAREIRRDGVDQDAKISSCTFPTSFPLALSYPGGL